MLNFVQMCTMHGPLASLKTIGLVPVFISHPPAWLVNLALLGDFEHVKISQGGDFFRTAFFFFLFICYLQFMSFDG